MNCKNGCLVYKDTDFVDIPHVSQRGWWVAKITIGKHRIYKMIALYLSEDIIMLEPGMNISDFINIVTVRCSKTAKFEWAGPILITK